RRAAAVVHRDLLRRDDPLHGRGLRADRRPGPGGQPTVRPPDVPRGPGAMSGPVETFRGPIGDPGATLMHEHIFGLSPEVLWKWPDSPEGWDLEERAREAAGKLNDLKAAGIDTVVDLTVIGLGRYVPAVQRVAEQTGVNIVAATGLYTYDALPPYF